FIDSPIKQYSSGMYMRLAFSVATEVDPDILIIDEILGVGDAGFQEKCYERILSFKKREKTIFFVSHALGTVRQLCDRAILLHNGELITDGRPADVICHYQEILARPLAVAR